jgi:ethanolamine ammonia-lyase small subunit
MKVPDLRRFTPARVALGRTGQALPTAELLKLQVAEVYAREAVHSSLDVTQLAADLAPLQRDILVVQSVAPDRTAYVRRPDWGRRLDDESRRRLSGRTGSCDVVFVIADGLSALAVHLHARVLLEHVLPLLSTEDWRIAPIIVVQQGRVAIGDEVGEIVGASLSVLLIGERPGLSASDGLSVYLTWNPHRGLTDADRNCLSNIRKGGLSYYAAAQRLALLMNEAKRLKLSGVNLKEGERVLSSPER